jgi:hypothetical protein
MAEGRQCNRCLKEKPWDSFSLNSNGLNGRKSICKLCSNKAETVRLKKNKEADPESFSKARREKMLRLTYGLTPEDYSKMLLAQGNTCAICKTAENRVGDYFFVDHCHTNGHNRGLLCYHCNTLLGMCFDDIDILQSAITYLERDKNG